MLGPHTRQRSLLQTSETCSLSAFFLLQSSRSFRSCTRRLAIVLSSPCPPESDSIVICYRRRDFAHHPSLAFLTIALLQPDQSLSRHLYALSPVRPSINIEITGALLNHSCSTASTSHNPTCQILQPPSTLEALVLFPTRAVTELVSIRKHQSEYT